MARNGKPQNGTDAPPPAPTFVNDERAAAQLRKLDAALEAAVEAAVKSGDVPTLLRLHAHFDERRKRPVNADAVDRAGPEHAALAAFGGG